MKMEFVFDEEKCLSVGLTIEDCLKGVRAFFEEYKEAAIVETAPGVFEGDSRYLEVFAAAFNFHHVDWFMETISEWYWHVDTEDENEVEDVLAIWKEVDRKNAKKL